MMALRVLISLSALALLGGCQTVGSKLPSVACTNFKAITYSKKGDTRTTVRQVVAHNAVGVATCGWRPNR